MLRIGEQAFRWNAPFLPDPQSALRGYGYLSGPDRDKSHRDRARHAFAGREGAGDRSTRGRAGWLIDDIGTRDLPTYRTNLEDQLR